MRAAERPDRYRHPQVLIDFLQADVLALEAELARLWEITEKARGHGWCCPTCNALAALKDQNADV